MAALLSYLAYPTGAPPYRTGMSRIPPSFKLQDASNETGKEASHKETDKSVLPKPYFAASPTPISHKSYLSPYVF